MNKLSNKGLEVIKQLEGEKLSPYLCSAGVPTIGYGSTIYENNTPVKMSDKPITKERAEELLKYTLQIFETAVNKTITQPMLQHQFDAFVLLCYNCGIGAFSRPAMVAKCFNAKDIKGVNEWWLKSFITVNNGKQIVQGLINRRKKELDIFNGKY
jgi:lysozyme